ncbi:glycogen synthase GlgA [Citroniella saccharovorans]|uniref:glycogen synthase GlgA n=1 Tax=Citroniella saccharovorans TaxID=2053367 RepID=UPI0036235A4E
MKVFYICSEATPFIKTGGLADIAGSLPKELKRKDIDISVVMPLYSKIKYNLEYQLEYIGYYYVDLSFKHIYTGVFKTVHNGVTHYFIDNEDYFNRDGLYGYDDDGERFGYFSKAVTVLFKYLNQKPDIVHTNDWHTALINLFVRDFSRGDSFYSNIKLIYTIHNLKYQGIFPKSLLWFLGLDESYFNEEELKFYDSINLMKCGIVFSDKFNTVSGTYALEVKHEFYGENLEGIIKKYDFKFRGILNGIDTSYWNPVNDKFIYQNYSLKTIDKKSINKLELQKELGLKEDAETPMFTLISRLVSMKGLDLIVRVIDEILQENIQLVVLGTGDRKFEMIFRQLSYRYPDKLRALIKFDEATSHRLYAAADFLLMPSIIEPCGVSQMIAMRYATLPIVRETGGLKDTVVPFNKYDNTGNGFSFENINAHELLFTIKYAISIYKKESFYKLRENAMNTDSSWAKRADDYINMYKVL